MRKRMFFVFLFVQMLSMNMLIACSSSSGVQGQPTSSAEQSPTVESSPTLTPTVVQESLLSALSNPSKSVKVQVPTSMRTAPFTQDLTLNVPSGFSISVYARIPSARFMAVTPDNNLLVSEPSLGKVELVRPGTNGGDPVVSDFITGLRLPQDIVFHKIGSTEYMYISESNEIDRYIYHTGDTQAQNRQVIISGLPDSHSPGFNGSYSHEYKSIELDSNNKLYLAISSSCNVCVSDTQSNPLRDAIYQYNADGTGGQLFAQGLRNAEGLAFVPGTNDLWVAVNERDNLAYPFQDNTGQYGQVIPSYVDNHPPDEFTAIKQGGNYGWPFCNPDPDKGLVNMPFDQDVQYNPSNSVDCTKMTRISQGLQAHSAPLGLTFIQNQQSTSQIGALIALHGSWDRTTRTGYKVIYFPWNTTTNTPGKQVDLVTGWLYDNNQAVWGRPVDTVLYQQSIFISDDLSGTIYRLSQA